MAMYKITKVKPPAEGSLAARAVKASMTPSAFAKANLHTFGIVGKLARIAYIKEAIHGGGDATMAKPGDSRKGKSKLYQVG